MMAIVFQLINFQAICLKPTMSESKAAAHYQQGLEARDASELTRAVCEFQLAIELNSRHAEAYLELGCATYASGASLEKARIYIETALKINPSLRYAHMYLAIVLNRLKMLDDSEAHFRIALGQSDDPALVHSTFAEEFLWHNSRYGEAEEHFMAALRHDPKCVLALRDYARMLACHGRDAEAKRLFVRALKLDPDDRYTKREYDEFLREIMSEDRNQDVCLRGAIEKDPNYTEGIMCLSKRRGGGNR